MDITSLSIPQLPVNQMTNINVAILNKNLDTIKQAGESFIKMMEQSVQPNLGQTIDIKL
ncbi:MAG: hypothetical protein K0S47_946 [Herbinix sp.]|jgi:hypothetical protein|nr:hypothetical protein [Herbinix sp.]